MINVESLSGLPSRTPILLNCLYCKRDFYRTKNRVLADYKRNKKKTFCSPTCSIKFSKEKIKYSNCLFCGESFPKHLSNSKFCSRICYSKSLIKPPKKCKICNHPLNKYTKKFCSNECKLDNNINLWLDGKLDGGTKHGYVKSFVRKHLLSVKGEKCWKCGWKKINPKTNKVPLQVNHIDGDCHNNKPSNLELICPNCHSLTPNYCALNKKSGRNWRNNKT